LLILFFSLASAAPVLNLQHEEIRAGETILATIQTPGEFTKQIEISDIKFLQGRKEISLESNIIFYEGIHYLYIYTTRPLNITLQIQNILYKELDTLKSTTITKQLNITEKTNQTLTIKPGFIFTNTVPKIKLINSGNKQLNLTYEKNETSLSPMQSTELTITPAEKFSNFEISTYKDFSIPIIYLKTEINETPIFKLSKPDLRSDKESITLELFTENKTKQKIQLFNFGDHNITNIKISHNTSFLEIEEIKIFQPREIQNITLTLEPETAGHFQDTIIISYTQNETNYEIEIALTLLVAPKNSSEKIFEIKEETCEEMSGKICDRENSYRCTGEEIFTTKGVNTEFCCLKECIEIKDPNSESGSYGWLIAIIIFLVLGIAGGALYKKQKQLKPQTSEDKMKEISTKFEKRLSGESNKVTGKLTKT